MSERLFALSELTLPEDIYTRARGTPWWANVHVYAEEMKAGAQFPPILVGQIEDKLIVVDGVHRYLATKKLGIEYIQGILKKYKSMADLLVDAVAANNHHGIRYTPQDKSHIASLLQKHGLEPQRISELVRIPVEKLANFTVRNITGPMGKKTLKGPLMRLVRQGKITEAEAYEVFQGRFSTMTIDDVIVQLINYLEFGAYPWGDKKYFVYASRITSLMQPYLKETLGLREGREYVNPCIKGLDYPLQDLETCQGCEQYKRKYGKSPAACTWPEWLKIGWENELEKDKKPEE